MDMQKWSLRVGAAALLCALAFRLGGSGALQTAAQALTAPKTMSLMLFLESGRILRSRPAQVQESAQSSPDEQPEETLPLSAQPQQTVDSAVDTPAVFRQEDSRLVEVNSYCGYKADVPAMILEPLTWDLRQTKPTVLIVHSHGSESYENTEDYEECSNYRTLNTDYNMISVGAELKEVLEAGGITVIHDTIMHDQPSYNASYSKSRKSVKSYLQQYPSICLVLDLHRDAVENSKGKQVKFTAKKDGLTAAQLMLVVGTDVRLDHPDWPENMSLAVKLHAMLEKEFPGICRPISFRSQRFNQDLSPGALLVEVGSAGNTRQEALEAVRVLGKAVLELSKGSNLS